MLGRWIRSLMSEVIFLAEHIDMAEFRGQPLDFDRMWADGVLIGDRERVKALLEEPWEQAA